MAKQMNFTDRTGSQHPVSYWRVSTIMISVDKKLCEIIFKGYHSQQARNEGFEECGVKRFVVEGAEFDALYAQHLESDRTKSKNIMELAYAVAMSHTEPTGQTTVVNGQPQPEFKSFFDGASDLL